MLQKIKIFILSISSLMLFAVPATVIAASPSNLNSTGNLCSGSNLDLNGGTACDTGAGDSLNTTIARIINVISVVVAAVAVIMLIIGGFRYVTSAGAEASVKGAKNTILYAIIGLVIVAMAQIVVKFVINKTTSG